MRKKFILMASLLSSVALTGCGNETVKEQPQEPQAVKQIKPATLPKVVSAPMIPAHRAVESKNLMQIEQHLKATYALIDQAEKEQHPYSRVKFRYDWLKRDLVSITQSLEQYRNRTDTSPRNFEPLKGEYAQ